MHPLLAEFIFCWKRKTPYCKPCDWVFASFRLKGRQPRVANMLVEDYLRPAAVKAGILSSHRDDRGRLVDDDPRRFGFHNLRHSLASFLVRIKTDPKTVQTLLRHSDVKLTLQWYTHSVSDDRRLGALLLQFPISFKYTEGNWDHLIDVLHLFREYPLAVEVRHKTWADPLVLKALTQENIAFCNIDQTRLGETLEGTEHVTASLAYLRLHGRSKEWFTAKNRDARYDYLYSKDSLLKVKTKLENMAAAADVTFVAANNHPRGQAAANAVELKAFLSGDKVKAPETLIKTYPVLAEFAVPEATNLPSEIVAPPQSTETQSRKSKKHKINEGQRDLPL